VMTGDERKCGYHQMDAPYRSTQCE